MRCLRQPQPTLKASFSHAGDAKVNKKRDSSGDVFGRIARPSGWINRQGGHGDGSTGNTARRLSMTYPDGRVIDYLYGDAESLDDHLSRVAGLKIDGEGPDLATYSYVGEARYVRIAYPEPRIELSYVVNPGEPERDSGDPYTGYDRFGRTVDMKWQTSGGATMLDRVQYGYDRSGSRTWRRDLAAPAGHDEFFRYDALHQVTDLARGNLNLNQTAIGGIPAFEERFDYDPTGNWNRYTSATDGTETLDQTRVNNRDNQITQLDGSNEGILYDRAGQALQMPPDANGDWGQYYHLVWDAWGRLVQVKDGSLATVAAYAYEGTTRRITKTVDGTTVHSYYNERWKAIEEREGSATDAARQYLWGARPNHRDELVRSERDTTGGGTLDERLYCLMDYYDPIAMTDTSGEAVERYEFSAFGLRAVMNAAWAPLTASAHAVEFAFHGQILDAETGYYDYGYRYYSPQIGRWLSKDPIEEQGGVNLYAFSDNCAVNRNDMMGLQSNSEKLTKLLKDPSTIKKLDDVGSAKSIEALKLTRATPINEPIGYISSYLTGQPEYCGNICLRCTNDEAEVYSTGPELGTSGTGSTPATCNVHHDASLNCDEGDVSYAYYHSHPGARSFSGQPGSPGTADYAVAYVYFNRNRTHFEVAAGGGFAAFNSGPLDDNIKKMEGKQNAAAQVHFTSGTNAGTQVFNGNIEITIVYKK